MALWREKKRISVIGIINARGEASLFFVQSPLRGIKEIYACTVLNYLLALDTTNLIVKQMLNNHT